MRRTHAVVMPRSQDWTAQAWTGLSRPFSFVFESTENRKLITHLLDLCLLGFAFCPSFHPPEELSLETWVETSRYTLPLCLPPFVVLCMCHLSWKRRLDSSVLGLQSKLTF